jgi:hypothetical protein
MQRAMCYRSLVSKVKLHPLVYASGYYFLTGNVFHAGLREVRRVVHGRSNVGDVDTQGSLL